MKTIHHWINGKQVAGKGTRKSAVFNPATGDQTGELVLATSAEMDAAVQAGQIVGWVEGFKAISDVYCVATGFFLGGNPELREKISLVDKQPYAAGWLYAVRGTPDERCLDVHAYRDHLDRAIDLILSKQKAEST